MSEKKEPKTETNKSKPLLILLVVTAGLIYFITKNPQAFWNISLMLLGFGAVIFVHELGHFIAAKSVNIEVESFSIGINPIIFGIKRVEGGYLIRILPGLFPGRGGKGRLSFFIPRTQARPGETEYRLCLIPFGGFVKMLGQEDLAADEPSDNPRAYGNKPVWQRIIVISAGVFMNIISAGVVFMLVFAQGLELPPAVVGYADPDKPAAQAGIKGGDEIIAINGRENVSFMHLTIAAAFADEGEKVALTVRHPDGSTDIYHVQPRPPVNELEKQRGVKILGIEPPSTLTIAEIKDDHDFLDSLQKIGFEPGDKIVAVNRSPITRYDQLHDILSPAVGVISPDRITLTVERADMTGKTTRHDVDIPMRLVPAGTEKTAGLVLGLIPRLKIVKVAEDFAARQAGAKVGDIILRFGNINNPTYEELSAYCKDYENQPVALVVARAQDGQTSDVTLKVTPKRPHGNLWQLLPFVAKPKAIIGVGLERDLDHPVVAQVEKINKDSEPLPLPRGAKIISIADQAVNSWQDVIEQLLAAQGRRVDLTCRMPDSELTETLTAAVPDNNQWLGFVFRGDFGEMAGLPLQPLERIFQGKNWLHDLRLGADMTGSFLAQSYLFIRGALKGEISLKAASGPVGILKMSYTVAREKSFTYYCYFIAIISVCIAFFNFLPLPILDGGHILMLLIEKIKGAPVSIKVQEIVTYAGLLLIGSLFLVVTFNDIVKIITGQL